MNNRFNINDLPDDCIICIFNACKLPLQSLIPLRSVCKRWQRVIIEQICHRKRTLKLFGSVESDLVTYCHFLMDYNLEADGRFQLKPIGRDDDLIIRTDCEPDFLCHLFPNVESLVVYLTRFSSHMFNMPYLLDNLKNLSSLTFFYMPYPIDHQHQIWSAINSMERLTSLSLFSIFQCTIPKKMSILGQLENFSLNGYYEDVVSIIKQLGPNLKRLQLDDIHCSAEQLLVGLAANPSLAANLTHLTIGYINNGINTKPTLGIKKRRHVFDRICAQFRSLKYLAFTSYATHLPNIAFEEMFPSLCQFPGLTELHLPYNWNSSSHPDAFSRFHSTTQPLKTVKLLYLAFSPARDANQNEFPRVDVRSIFPNVEEVNVSGNSKLLQDAKEFLCHFNIKGLCKVNYCLKSDDVAQLIGRHSERYQKYLDELTAY